MPAQDPYLKLWCLVKGDQNAFSVTVPRAARVAQLKELIHRKKERGSFRQLDVNPSELELFKVWYLPACATLRSSPSLYLRSIWPSSLNETSFLPSVSAPKIKTLLWSPIRGTPVSDFWIRQPSELHLHIFVVPPARGVMFYVRTALDRLSRLLLTWIPLSAFCTSLLHRILSTFIFIPAQ